MAELNLMAILFGLVSLTVAGEAAEAAQADLDRVRPVGRVRAELGRVAGDRAASEEKGSTAPGR